MSKPAKNGATFEAANLEAARIIAADPAKYPAGSLLSQWADMILNPVAERSKPTVRRAA